MGGKLIARKGDRVHHGPVCGSLKESQTNTWVEGQLVALADATADDEDGDQGTPCSHGDDDGHVETGASRVYCHGGQVARKGDPVKCGGKILEHCSRTWAGD